MKFMREGGRETHRRTLLSVLSCLISNSVPFLTALTGAPFEGSPWKPM